MVHTISKSTADSLIELRDRLSEERPRLESLLRDVEVALREIGPAKATKVTKKETAAPRASPLDKTAGVTAATADLRVSNGNLSADRVAKLYGVSLSKLAGWLGRTRQAVGKTPDSESLQNALGYFARVARLRAIAKSDQAFRKWLRTPNDNLDNESPLDLMRQGEWQVMADLVDDMLTGAPT